MNKKILIIGPGRATEGGITSVIMEYENNELWHNHRCKWIETYNNKNNFLKIIYFVRGFFQFLLFLPFCKIVHIHFSWKLSAIRKLPFFVFAKLFRKKAIVHLHSGSDPIIDSGVKGIYQYFFKNADITILLAHQIKDQLLKEFVFKKVIVVYNPVLVKPETNNIKKQQKILFAGHINEKKGIFDLVVAFSKICHQNQSWKLEIAGSGNIQKLNDLIENLGIAEQTEFLGWIKGEDKNRVFKSCSIFCLPSYTEGFPMSVLEAWAYKLPVITTAVGGLQDVLEHGKNALVFTPGDINALSENLLELINNELLRNKLGEASLQLVNSTFNINVVLKQLDELYFTLS
jgi:glycosyltransferase involved in cell wall biosynthesis